ncbi:MAG: hypothetical protein DPW18_18025 [Chloroflexi bacterium]|nr:hypothetical protein [Chloroflexota bacterium]MDL1941916.1 hypothetical protein [Chloroflexi bacterium CFX2]
MEQKANVVWNYDGEPDFMAGTGATIAEQALGWAAGLMGAGLYVYLYLTGQLDWAWWQYLVAGLLAFDVAGGVVANALNSCKRFYHTPARADEPPSARWFKNHLFFSSFHVHTLLAAWLFGPGDLLYGVFWYFFLLGGTLIVTRTALYLQRPVSFFLIVLALLLNMYVVAPVPGFEWLAPAIMIKILYAHNVREEPYRPSSETPA